MLPRCLTQRPDWAVGLKGRIWAQVGIYPGSVPMSYRVKLDVFDGPLELLLHLLEQDKLDIRDIEISRITQQYFGLLGHHAGVRPRGHRRFLGDGSEAPFRSR